MSSREFNQDVGRAKRAAADGPVVITDRSRPSHVLLSYEDYAKLTRASGSIVELLADDRAAGIPFETTRGKTRSFRDVDYSE